MADSRLVKDVMVLALQLEASARAVDALRTLDQHDIEYGVVSDECGDLLIIVTKEQLRTIKADQPLQALTINVPHPIHIEPDDAFDSIVQIWMDDFALNKDLVGIVVQQQGKVLGILLRETIQELSQVMAVGRLEGTSKGRVTYKCLKCPRGSKCPGGPERKEVTHFDRKNPPTCSRGLEMERVRE
jgi:hypothetical protein